VVAGPAAGGAVRAVLPRRGVVRRAGGDGREEVLAANVDLLLVAGSLNRELNVRRLERMLALAGPGVATLVLLTKGDLSADPVGEAMRVQDALGAEALVLSAHDGWGLGALHARLPPRATAALVGSSGVGKSTLVNALLGEERQRTLPVRAGDDRGRHATTRRELLVLPGGALLIDTPGLRTPRPAASTGVEEAFADVEALARGCRFADCSHTSEPACAVRDAVAPGRLAAFRKLAREARWAEERQDPAGAAARRARARAAQREYRKAVHRRA
jgi:ribosome biogenesis GTPase / thiamine phosphate phosphatase